MELVFKDMASMRLAKKSKWDKDMRKNPKKWWQRMPRFREGKYCHT
jgi:hypothetical protein